MQARDNHRVHVVAALLVSVMPACKRSEQRVCADIGREGGILQSYDTVLTIAIQPEGLDETERFCISPTDDVPSLFGEAYRVDPAVRLNYDAIVSYRGQLPDDLSDANIGRVSRRDFEAGKGKWQSLGDCRVDADVRSVDCPDREVSMFYGLLDRFAGSDSNASEPTGTGDDGTTSLTSAETGTMPTTMTTTSMETSTSETGDQPIDYPPECDTPVDGPFELVELGVQFEPAGNGGAEDMAPDGQGGFVARREGGLARLDVTGATLGGVDGFSVADLLDSPSFAQATLGVRYAPSGELVLGQTDGQLRAMAGNGDLRTITDEITLPNGVFVGLDSTIWFTDFVTNSVNRIPLRGGDVTVIAQIPTPNGIYYDPLRELLFYVSVEQANLWRVAVTADGRPGEPEMVADIGGGPDGVVMDECGSAYILDNNGGSDARLIRVDMDDDGVMNEVVELVTGIGGGAANGVFGVGEAYGEFQTSVFITGVPGEISYVDVGRRGAPVPGLSRPPATEGGGTDTGGSSSDTGIATAEGSSGTTDGSSGTTGGSSGSTEGSSGTTDAGSGTTTGSTGI